jgi:hypothetical protein
MNQDNAVALWQMYIHWGVKAIADAPNADAVIIMQTANDKQYIFPIQLADSFVPPIISALEAAKDTHVLRLVHIWKNHWLDMPAYDLLKALTQLHPENENAQLMLIGEKGFVMHSIKDTMS